MALGVMVWDLPSEEQMEAYLDKARTEWIPTVLKQPGVKEFRAYRNPYLTSPQILIVTEFDSLASWLKWLESDDYANVMAGLRATGCTNIAAQVWGPSPVVPEPLKPPGS